MKQDDVKNWIEKLSKEEDCDKLKKGIRELNNKIGTYTIKKINRGSYFDFYEIIGNHYDDFKKKTVDDLGPKLGKIPKDIYEKHKEEIERLRKCSYKKELMEFIETLS